MDIADLRKVNDLASHYEECNKQLKILQDGEIKICMKTGYHLYKIPDDVLGTQSPVRIILLNELEKVRANLENELSKLGVSAKDS